MPPSQDLKKSYRIAGAAFLRMLGVVYLIAFVSLWTQVSGLVGDHGILPVSEFLDSAQRHFAAKNPPASALWNLPTLLWLSPHDGLLHGLCAAGTLAAVMLIAGLCPLPALAVLWAAYLSLFYAGQAFLSFQWDVLLLETGFVALFMAPWRWRIGSVANWRPPRLAIWLVWWLLFRLMFESGAVKLTWNDGQLGPTGAPLANTWESWTALDYHYWTQPLPIWTSWYAAKLPAWFQKLSVLGVLFVELVLPWFIFGPRRLRHVAFGGFSVLMLLIAITGNYNFFNLLAFVLALTLLDDSAWPGFLQRRIHRMEQANQPAARRRPNVLRWAFAVLVFVLGTLQLKQAVLPADLPRTALEATLHIDQFMWVNDYGLFRRMTETRPELVIEGSVDGTNWLPYEFRWKPGDPARPPRFNTPHQPRLDWQMWFEALRLERVQQRTGTVDVRYASRWFQSFLQQLLRGQPSVVDLLEKDPFPAGAPRFVRVLLYQYRFTTGAEREATGDWWRRELVATGSAQSLPALAFVFAPR